MLTSQLREATAAMGVTMTPAEAAFTAYWAVITRLNGMQPQAFTEQRQIGKLAWIAASASSIMTCEDPALNASWLQLLITLMILDAPGPGVTDPACTDVLKMAALRRLESDVAAVRGALDARMMQYGSVPE